MKQTLLVFLLAFTVGSFNAQLTLLDSFDPAEAGSLCGIGYDPDSSHIWVYECFASQIHCYDTTGAYVKSFSIGGEVANDVDFDFSSEDFEMDGSTISAFDILFINGETDNAEIYAIDRSSGQVIDTLNTSFGLGHVVGGSWHHGHDSFFLIQDNVPGTADENTVAEIDPATGDTLQTFQTTADFSVSYGDLEVCTESGNLYIVSSDESTIVEYTPEGTFVQYHPLPVGVNSLSGIAMDYTAGTAWVCNTNGTVYLIGGINCMCLPTESNINATTCNTYTSPSGLYMWDEDGTYMDMVVNSTGCDSLITINLEVVEINTTVNIEGGTLTVQQDNAAYQWLDCDNGLAPIDGADSQSYMPSVSGSYAVMIMQEPCADTSDCAFISVGVNEIFLASSFHVFPNPSMDDVALSFTLLQNAEVSLQLMNVLGENVSLNTSGTTKNFSTGMHAVQLSLVHLPAGVYVVEMKAGDEVVSERIVKE